MNTSRMNRLEELGRVDNEKAYTKKGKRNLKDEKKRVVGELKMRKGGKVKKDNDVSDMVKPGSTRFFDSDEVRAAKRKADKKNKKRIDKQRKELGYKAGGGVGSSKSRTGPTGKKTPTKGKKMMSGGKVKAYKKGGKIDGCAIKGHTRGRMV